MSPFSWKLRVSRQRRSPARPVSGCFETRIIHTVIIDTIIGNNNNNRHGLIADGAVELANHQPRAKLNAFRSRNVSEQKRERLVRRRKGLLPSTAKRIYLNIAGQETGLMGGASGTTCSDSSSLTNVSALQ